MEKKRILLQCHRLSYFYMGLGAIYTKFPKKDVIVDVLFTVKAKDLTMDYVKDNPNINDFFVCLYQNKLKSAYNKLKKLKNNIEGRIYFNFIFKNKYLKNMKKLWKNNKYDYCFFCEGNWIADIIYLANPAQKYVMYGDGTGLIYHGSYSKLINIKNKCEKPYFIPKVSPDEIIALAPYRKDNSMDITGIPVSGTSPKILLELIESDSKIQNIADKFADEIENNYRDCDKKILLIDGRIENPRYMMSKDEQINLYADIINQNTTKDSLLIIKSHPESSEDYSVLSEKCACRIIQIPKELSIFPIELFSKFFKKIDAVIPFLSSANISLKMLYDVDRISVYDIVQNYNLKYRANTDILFFEKVLKNLENWDNKSLVYEEDVIPAYKEFYNLYENKDNRHITPDSRRNTFCENIFSVRNIASDGKEFKMLTILYLKIKFKKTK